MFSSLAFKYHILAGKQHSCLVWPTSYLLSLSLSLSHYLIRPTFSYCCVSARKKNDHPLTMTNPPWRCSFSLTKIDKLCISSSLSCPLFINERMTLTFTLSSSSSSCLSAFHSLSFLLFGHHLHLQINDFNRSNKNFSTLKMCEIFHHFPMCSRIIFLFLLLSPDTKICVSGLLSVFHTSVLSLSLTVGVYVSACLCNFRKV